MGCGVESVVECVVLVHGTLDRAAGMLRVARRLGGFEVTRYDRRGYGRSSATGPAANFDEQLDDLAAVLGDRRSVVFGHSYGGVVALALAARRHHGIAAVVSYEAPRAWEPWWSPPPPTDVDPAEVAEQFCRAVMGEQVWNSLPAEARAARRREGSAMVAELGQQYVRRYDATQIEVPVIVGVGELSGDRTQSAARLTAAEAPAGELCVVAGAGHGAHMSHPEEVVAMVARAAELAA